MSTPSTPDTTRPVRPPAAATVRPLGGIAVGVALVLLAVLAGVIAQRAAGAGSSTPGAAVPATGHTTVVAVTATGMRYHPDRVTVPAGDRLVIQLTNTDNRRHDLVLATGPRTPLLGKGGTAAWTPVSSAPPCRAGAASPPTASPG
jgi:nitrite reductase (NO-forming)